MIYRSHPADPSQRLKICLPFVLLVSLLFLPQLASSAIRVTDTNATPSQSGGGIVVALSHDNIAYSTGTYPTYYNGGSVRWFPIGSYEHYPIGPTTHYKGDADICDTFVVYDDFLPDPLVPPWGTYNVYIHNIVTGQTEAMSYSASNEIHPAVGERFAVYQTDVMGNWDIIGYKLATQQMFVISTAEYDDTEPSVDDSLFAWQTDEGGNSQIYAKKYGQSIQAVATGPEDETYPDVSDDRIVFLQGTNVVLFDYASGDTTVITNDTKERLRPKISGNNVVWAEQVDGYWNVFLYNIADSLIYQLTNDPWNHWFCDVDGNRAVYWDGRTSYYHDIRILEWEWYFGPLAEAGPDQTVDAWETVQLSGTAFDPDTMTTFEWLWTVQSRPTGSGAVLAGPATQHPTFVPDQPGTYVIDLKVSDGTEWSAPDTVVVSARGDVSIQVTDTLLTPWGANKYDGVIAGSNVAYVTDVMGNEDICRLVIGTYGYDWVATGTSNQSKPDICGDSIVYQDDAGGNNNLYLYDIGTDHTEMLTYSASEETDPAISAGNVAHVTNMSGNDDIYRYDFAAYREYMVATTSYAEAEPCIDGNLIAWQTDEAGNSQIYAREISPPGQPIQTVADGPTDEMHPEISQERIVYLDETNIRLFDFNSAQTVVVTNDTKERIHPKISENYVLWMEKTNVNWDIYLYNIADSLIYQVTNDPWDHWLTDVEGNRAVYVTNLVGYKNINMLQWHINHGPIADAGADQAVDTWDTVHLSGAAFDPDTTFTFQWLWAIQSRPNGSSAAVSDPASQNPTFVPDQPGTYIISLRASDGIDWGAPDTVVVAARRTLWRVPLDAGTIQAGLDSALVGDTVQVSCGTYLEHDIMLKGSVLLRSETGLANCVMIDAQQLGAVMYADSIPDTSEVVVEGFTITGGKHGPYGGGVVVENSRLRLTKCRVASNNAKFGGGLSCRGGAGFVQAVDCVFANNSSLAGGGIYLGAGAELTVEGCTIYGNAATGSAAGAYLEAGAMSTFDRTVIAFSPDGEAVYCGDAGGVQDMSCCNVYANHDGDFTGCLIWWAGHDGNFSADPVFCYPDTGNLAIRDDSPCAPANSPSGCGLIGALGVGCALIGVEEKKAEIPTVFYMAPAAPNPFNPITNISYGIPARAEAESGSSRVTLDLFDVTGRRVRSLVDQDQAPGIYRVIWDGRDDAGVIVASGVYFCRLTWNHKSQTSRIVLLK